MMMETYFAGIWECCKDDVRNALHVALYLISMFGSWKGWVALDLLEISTGLRLLGGWGTVLDFDRFAFVLFV